MASQTIGRVVSFLVQDDWRRAIDPADEISCSTNGIRPFTVTDLDGTVLPEVAANNRARCTVNFEPLKLAGIRVVDTPSAKAWPAIVEVEAHEECFTVNSSKWGVPRGARYRRNQLRGSAVLAAARRAPRR